MVNSKLLGFMLLVIIVYLVMIFRYYDNKFLNRKEAVNLNHVIVHLDLKGAPPKLKYLETLLPFLKKYEVDGILMEYEDMFPYEGNLVNISSRYRYDREELKHFLSEAVKHEIEIIPLIQTFGHMEHVLKLKEYKHLREVEQFPDSICPSNPQSLQLIKAMLKQVISFHASITPLQHIHIGCDEVYHIGKCEKCVGDNKTNQDIFFFINHIRNIKKIIQDINPYTKVLMWDDMIRSQMLHLWSSKQADMLNEIEPVYWDYNTNGGGSHYNLYFYQKKFDNIWISTAFKGADGPERNIPAYRNRTQNHFNWMAKILKYPYNNLKGTNYEGIIITGWSRYSHMDPLCELLPASLTSLLLNLLVIKKFRTGVCLADVYRPPAMFFNQYILKEFYNEFDCDIKIDFDNLDETIDYCAIGSKQLLDLLKEYKNVVELVNAQLTDASSFEYYSKIKYFNMNRVDENIERWKKILQNISNWEKDMREAMTPYFDKFVIDEYVGYKIFPMKSKGKRMLKMLDDYKRVRTWGRNPLSFPE